MKNFIIYLRLIRMEQWIKNGFVVMPIIFSGRLFNPYELIRVIIATGAFCLLSSSVYILNDLKDLDCDKLHHKKRNRPLAAGLIKIPQAVFISLILLLISLVLFYIVGKKTFFVAALYFMLNIFRNNVLKKVVLLDVISIAIGFEFRVWAGSVCLNILPSIWLQFCVFVLAIFLGFIKRRHEKVSLYDKAAEHRGVLVHYTAYFLDQMIMISATLCIVFYSLYVLSEEVTRRVGGGHIAYTLPFVVYGVFRYLYLVHVKKLGGDPGEILLRDFSFTLNTLLWISSIIFILYGVK
jgi:4-hydroxybenzoate polyprenyltransferase